MALSYIELHARLGARIFGGLAAGLSTTITGSQITSLASSSTSAVSAILAALLPAGPSPLPEVIQFQAEQCAIVFAELASGLVSISAPQITAIASSAVVALAAAQASVNSAIGATASGEDLELQVRGAIRVFAGLARGLSSITQNQINTIASSAASAASAIQAAA